MPTPISSRVELVKAVARDLDGLCATVAADVGETPEAVRPDVELALRLLAAKEQARNKRTGARATFLQRGAEAANEGLAAEQLIDRVLSTLPAIWDSALAMRPTSEALSDLGIWLLRGADITAQAIAEGYTTADRAIVARDVTARRAFLDEILSTFPPDEPAAARLRRLASRYGLNPAAAYRLIAIAPAQGSGDEEAHHVADQIALRIRAPSSAERARTPGGLTLPWVIARHGRVIVITRADWPGLKRLRAALEKQPPGWIAVAGGEIDGVEGLSASMARLVDTIRAASRLTGPGWIDHPDDLAVERLLLLDESLLEAVVRRELGPLLDVPRMGDELVETLRVYFESGENMRETARRLHLASRTVAYRLQRIERILGRPIDGVARPRLSVALLADRAIGGRVTGGRVTGGRAT